MAQHRFKWYVHDDDLWEAQDEFKQINPHLSDEVVDHLINNNPFYEVDLTGVYDDVSGNIWFERADGC